MFEMLDKGVDVLMEQMGARDHHVEYRNPNELIGLTMTGMKKFKIQFEAREIVRKNGHPKKLK
ncbi:MAG: hypothetical protein ACJAVI_002858 [Candidatus Azotimanducaceae bacterium]|jgi:hypothetical protein